MTSDLAWWVRDVDGIGHAYGTGLADLAMANSVLSVPGDADLAIGGAGPVFQRAYRWFMNAATNEPSVPVRTDHYLNAVYSLNNFAVYTIKVVANWGVDPQEVVNQAGDALKEAQRVLSAIPPEHDFARGGVLWNYGNLLSLVGQRSDADEYYNLARGYGFQI